MHIVFTENSGILCDFLPRPFGQRNTPQVRVRNFFQFSCQLFNALTLCIGFSTYNHITIILRKEVFG